MSNISKNLDTATCLENIQLEGLRGIRTMLRAVLMYKPKFWVIENVQRSASWITSILQITHKVTKDGTLTRYKTSSVHPTEKDKRHKSYIKTRKLASLCFKRYGRPIFLHAGSGSGGRYFFGHFPPMKFKNNWIKKKMPNTAKENGYRRINTLGSPATRSLVDKNISIAFARAFSNATQKMHSSTQPSITMYTKRQKRRLRRLGTPGSANDGETNLFQ